MRLGTWFTQSSPVRRTVAALALTALLGGSGTALAGLTVDEVIKMTNIGVSDAVIITAIEASGSTFELTPQDIQRLREAGVHDPVINAMQMPRETDEPEAQPAAPSVAPQPDPTPPPVSEPDAPTVQTAPATTGGSRSTGVIDPASLRPLPAALKEVERQYKAGKFVTAAVGAYDLLIGPNKDEYAEFRPDTLYWLAKSLLKLGYVHSAHDLMLTVAKEGPGSRNFSNSLIYLTLTSRKLHDYRGLKDIFADTQPDDVPAKAKDAYLYLHGMAKYEAEDFADALQYLDRVSARSEFWIQSRYLEGLIRYRQGDNTQAARIFQEIVEADNVLGSPADVRNTQDMALLNIARVYYRVEDFQRSRQIYGLMPRESAYWPRALYEAAYANFWLQDYNYGLGQILTIYSPFFGDRIFMPDATILESLIYFNLCEYDRVIGLVDGFQAQWSPIRDDLRTFTSTLSTRPADAYSALNGPVNGVPDLPVSVVVETRYNTDLQDIERHLKMIEAEQALLAEQNVKWINSPLGTQLTQLLTRDRDRLRIDAGNLVLQEVTRLDHTLSGLIGESDIIEFEVLNAQKETYEEQFRNPEYVETYEELERSYATEARFIYWPFTGEFWKDELGNYRFTESGSCKR